MCASIKTMSHTPCHLSVIRMKPTTRICSLLYPTCCPTILLDTLNLGVWKGGRDVPERSTHDG